MEDGSRMRQVLFTIPIFGGIKLFGYGSMMVLAFIGSTWAATWRARREKLEPDVILDMAFWIFFLGMVGAGSSIASSTGDAASTASWTSSSTGKAASSTTAESWAA